MLIGEASRGCIHPHADAIYRSAADVRVSPSFDDEINKLRRRMGRRSELCMVVSAQSSTVQTHSSASQISGPAGGGGGGGGACRGGSDMD